MPLCVCVPSCSVVSDSCSPRDSQQSSPTPQFTSINTSVLSFLYGPTLISIHDYWKIHSFTRWNLSSKVKSPLFSALSRLVIAFLPRSMLSGKLELIYRGSQICEKNHKPMKQGAQMRVVPDLVKSAVHVPG